MLSVTFPINALPFSANSLRILSKHSLHSLRILCIPYRSLLWILTCSSAKNEGYSLQFAEEFCREFSENSVRIPREHSLAWRMHSQWFLRGVFHVFHSQLRPLRNAECCLKILQRIFREFFKFSKLFDDNLMCKSSFEGMAQQHI